MERSDSAKQRYPEDDGFYRPSFDRKLLIPCRCKDSCPNGCRGDCGCPACRVAFDEWDAYGSMDG